jgi:hypothetical protein
MDLVALVPKDLSDLIDGFLQNRSQDIEKLKSALAAGDFATVQQVGERMYALGNPYGFRQITTFGRLIREACGRHDDVSIRQLLGQYEDYLGKVTLSIVAEPVERVAWNPARPPWAKDEDDRGEEPSDQRQRRQYGPPG